MFVRKLWHTISCWPVCLNMWVIRYVKYSCMWLEWYMWCSLPLIFHRAWLRMAVMLRSMKACTLDSCKFLFYPCDKAACFFHWSTNASRLSCLLFEEISSEDWYRNGLHVFPFYRLVLIWFAGIHFHLMFSDVWLRFVSEANRFLMKSVPQWDVDIWYRLLKPINKNHLIWNMFSSVTQDCF